MENKFDAILKEIRTNKTTSTITNPRSEINGTQNSQPSGSKSNRSNGVHASNLENSDTEDEDDHPLRASEMHELRNAARPVYQNIPNLDGTIVSNEDSEEEEDCHRLRNIFPDRNVPPLGFWYYEILNFGRLGNTCAYSILSGAQTCALPSISNYVFLGNRKTVVLAWYL